MFHHPDGRTIYSIEYDLEPPAGMVSATLIVHLKEDGTAEHPAVFALPPNERIITTKPGQSIHAHGQVLGVRPYQWIEDGLSRSAYSPPPDRLR